MTATRWEHTPTEGGNRCIDISLVPAASHLKATDGREINFTRAVLTMRIVCEGGLVNVVPHATLGQEGGTVQDVTNAIAHSEPSSIPPGVTVNWDVFDLLLPAHQGTASKLHMFGYRAALNWRFDLAAWAEYRTSVDSEPVKTPVLKWSLRWSITDAATGAIGLTIDAIRD